MTNPDNSTSLTPHRFSFTGNGWEYFSIWIVNTALNILTFGIYSPWAKVRREKYFHNHTSVAGGAFDYTANPMKILKGRIIIFVSFIIFSIVNSFNEALSWLLLLALIVVTPWIITAALKFRARYTTYRNLPFSFKGTPSGVFNSFLLWRLLGFISFGLLLPYAKKKERTYVVNNIGYGGKIIESNPDTMSFYGAYLKSMALVLIPIVIAVGIFTVRSLTATFTDSVAEPQTWTADAEDDQEATNYPDDEAAYDDQQVYGDDEAKFDEEKLEKSLAAIMDYFLNSTGAMLMVGFGLLAFAMIPVAKLALKAIIAKIMWNSSHLGKLHFQYNIRIPQYVWILFSNVILVMFTLGFATPFCAVRVHRYRIDNMVLMGPGDLSQFNAQFEEQLRALGDQAADLYDIDIDLGF